MSKSKFQQRLEAALQKNERMKKSNDAVSDATNDAVKSGYVKTLEQKVQEKIDIQKNKQNMRKAFEIGCAIGNLDQEKMDKIFEQWYVNNID